MSHVRRMTLLGLLSVITITLATFASIGTAGALLQPFRVSPSSGPPGTVVGVSGTGCGPGPVASSADYVKITSTTLPISVDVAVAGNGSWHGRFTVPGRAVLGVGLVAATCFTDGVPSMTTYSPQSLTVTAAPATPTTRHPAGTPAPAPVPTPGAAVGGSPNHPAVPDAPAVGNAARSSGNGGSDAGNAQGTPAVAAAAAKLATASGAGEGLTAISTSGHHRSPWLWWLLFVFLLAIVAPSLVSIRRRHDARAATVPTAT